MRKLEAAVIALVTWGALSFGGAYPWGYWSLAAGAIVCGGWVFARTRAWRDPSVRRLTLAFGMVAVAIALQAVPLPSSVVNAVSPSAQHVLSASDVQFVLNPPAWRSLALVPDGPLVAGALLVAFGLLLVGLSYAIGRMRLEHVVVSVMVLGAALAVFAVMQRAANVRSADNDHWQLVYGFWKPRQAGDVFGPFINRNHFAGWMVMAVSLALGYSCAALETSGLSTRDRWARWLRWTMRPEASRFMTIALAIAAMGASLTASGSRSGMASFAVAIAVMAYFVGRRMERRRLRVLAVGYLAFLLVGAVVWAGASEAAGRFALATSDASGRLGAWRDTVHIIQDFPAVGTGLGGYGQAMLVYQTANRDMFYAHAHNDYLQVMAEGGLLVGLPVLWCAVMLVRQIAARVTAGDDALAVYWIRAGAIAGLAGIAAQSLVEFSLQLAGNTVLFVLLAAIALHRTPSYATRV
jgi:O-antigen ligase